MPMPPMPTKWIGPSSSGSLVAAFMRAFRASRPAASTSVDQPCGRVGPALGQRIAAPSPRPRSGRPGSRRCARASASGVKRRFRDQDRAPRPRPARARWRSGGRRWRRHRGSGSPAARSPRCRRPTRRPSATDHQLRLGQPARDVGEERLHLGRDRPPRHRRRCTRATSSSPGLMRHPQRAAQRLGQQPPRPQAPRRTGSARPGCRRSPAGSSDSRPAGCRARRPGPAPPRAPGCRCGCPARPSGSAVGQVPQATASTRGAKTRLTRPSTPFCSWIIRGRRSSTAAASAGIVG